MCSKHEAYTHYEHIKVHVHHTLKNNSSSTSCECFKTFMNNVSRTEKEEEEERKIILKKFIRTYEIHSSLKMHIIHLVSTFKNLKLFLQRDNSKNCLLNYN